MPILNALSDKKTSFTISTSTLRRYQFHQKMTERAPNKLYTTKFVQTQFVVPEKNIHRFFEAFLTVFDCRGLPPATAIGTQSDTTTILSLVPSQ